MGSEANDTRFSSTLKLIVARAILIIIYLVCRLFVAIVLKLKSWILGGLFVAIVLKLKSWILGGDRQGSQRH
ncbi:hypothetical protein SDJN02_07897, partial [Cucurbita argyrosperma subsp. argyrosperma]